MPCRKRAGSPSTGLRCANGFRRSPEYWTEWALAYFQRSIGLTFTEGASVIKPSAIRTLHPAFHEMGLRPFVDRMDDMYREARPAIP